MRDLLLIMRIGWKEGFRSPIWHRKMLVNSFLVLTMLYLAGNFILLGALLDDILMEVPLDDITMRSHGLPWVVMRLNKFLLYYLFFDFILRYFMQKLPTLSIQPLLHLPISKKSLAHFLLVKSLVNPFNIFPFLLFVPFMLELFENLPFAPAAGWSLAWVSIILAFHYLLLYLKRSSEANTWVFIALIASFVAIIALDYFSLIAFTDVSSAVFDTFVLWPLSALIPLILLFAAYFLNHRYLVKNMYMSRLARQKQQQVSYVGAGILSRFGLVGRLTELEFKLIWRNKRSRSVFLMTFLFLGYGLLVFPNPEFDGNHLMYVLFGILITGMFILNYGQYLLGWEGSYFDHILTRRVSYKDYYMSKFLLFAIVGLGGIILCIPYAYFGWDILIALFCVFLFNLGISSFFVMWLGSLNPKKIELSKGTVMNWQGVGASQFLMILPTMGLPMGLYFILSLFWGDTAAVFGLGILGALGLAGTPLWVRLLGDWLRSQRHSIANDFRNQ